MEINYEVLIGIGIIGFIGLIAGIILMYYGLKSKETED